MPADLISKCPDRFLYGSDQGVTADWELVRKSYEAWDPLGRTSVLHAKYIRKRLSDPGDTSINDMSFPPHKKANLARMTLYQMRLVKQTLTNWHM